MIFACAKEFMQSFCAPAVKRRLQKPRPLLTCRMGYRNIKKIHLISKSFSLGATDFQALKISIITICYNAAVHIRTAIESVLSQTYPDIEYIVIDGASKDGTPDIVREYSGRIAHFVSEPDKGIYDAMNKGIARATGEFVGILNSDDFYLSADVIQSVADACKSHPDKDIILGGVDFVRPDNLEKVCRRYPAAGFAPWMLRFGFMPPHPGAFIRKAVYEKIGHYQTDYKIAADFEFFVRSLLGFGTPFVIEDKIWVRMREGGVSTSGFKSYYISTGEMLKALAANHIYSNSMMVSLRLPFKYLKQKGAHA